MDSCEYYTRRDSMFTRDTNFERQVIRVDAPPDVPVLQDVSRRQSGAEEFGALLWANLSSVAFSSPCLPLGLHHRVRL